MKGVEINPGALCNARCVFCMSGFDRDRHGAWAPPEPLQAELLRFFSEGTRAVGFVGGEPTAYPHLLRSVAYAKRLGYERISIVTNGLRLADPAYARTLARAGATRFALSIHSHRAAVEERLVGVPRVLERQCRAVRNLVALRRQGHVPDNVSLNPVLCRLNMKELKEYVRFFRELGIDDVRFNFIWPRARVRRDPRIVPSYREAVPWMLDALLDNARGPDAHLSFGNVPPSVLPAFVHRRTDWARRYFGDSEMEKESSRHRPGAGGFERLDWLESEKGDFKKGLPACLGCRHRGACPGPWASYVELYGPEEFRPEG